MIDFSLAIRNLLRNRRRSFATFTALLLGTAATLMFSGFRKSIEYSMHTAFVRDGGHLQIQHRDLFLYGSGNPIKYSISDYQQVIDTLEKDPQLRPMLVAVAPTLQFGGVASNFSANVSRTVIGIGAVAELVSRMRDWNGLGLPILAPPFGLVDASPDAAILGTGVARVLLLCDALAVANCPSPAQEARAAGGAALPADIAALAAGNAPTVAATKSGKPRIELLASGAGGAPNVVSLQAVLAERQGFKELDEIYLMMHLRQAQRLVFGRSTPKATAILIQLQSSDQIEPARKRVTELLGSRAGDELVVHDFRALNPFFVQTVQLFEMIFGFIFILISSIVLFTVSNTMNTAVMERTVEIGTIRTLGLRRRGVQRLFVVEGMLLGVTGTITGAIIALVLSFIINHSGMTWEPPGSSGGRLPLLLLVWGEWGTVIGTVAGLIAIAALSAWWPAQRASRLVIVDALRHA